MDGELGTQTGSAMMGGGDEFTELWFFKFVNIRSLHFRSMDC